jgi:hypothetical protein
VYNIFKMYYTENVKLERKLLWKYLH